MKRYYTYEVIEDNGGGLTLALSWRGRMRYVFPDWEYHSDDLVPSLDDLDAGVADPENWDNAMPNPAQVVANIKSYAYGWQVICYGGHHSRTIRRNLMGAAGLLAFAEV